MSDPYDVATLASLYDKGRLVPFIGSGMSVPQCESWKGFVARLCEHAGVEPSPTDKDPAKSAATALECLRRGGQDVGAAVRNSVYSADDDEGSETHAQKLAQLVWPLVCTTNYDDIYVDEVQAQRKSIVTVRGRSESDCRRVAQHLDLPDGELLWALQGFLSPRRAELRSCVDGLPNRLESELVVGPVEYRQAAHLQPHFRRAFGDVFRHRTFLFLGAGLAESYILTLFDEIIALSGPPSTPHFALVQEGSVDVDLMREHYQIICKTYRRGEYSEVSRFLERLKDAVEGTRTRPTRWSFNVTAPHRVKAGRGRRSFEVSRAGLPDMHMISARDIVAISCGRADDSTERGRPLPGHLLDDRLPEASWNNYQWLSDWALIWPDDCRIYGIVARQRHPIGGGGSSRDVRDPESVRVAFKDFLSVAQARGVHTAHVQLLAAGRKRVFRSWVSLAQMARAYGQWYRESHEPERMKVVVYVVAPDAIAAINAGYLNLAEHLDDAMLRIRIEVIDAQGSVRTHHHLANANEELGNLPVFRIGPEAPLVHTIPSPRLRADTRPLDVEMRSTGLRDFGLVSGSTLVVDYREPNVSRNPS